MATYKLKRRLYAAPGAKSVFNLVGNLKTAFGKEASEVARNAAMGQAAKGALMYGTAAGLGGYTAYKAGSTTKDILTGNLGKENGDGY